MGNPPPFLTLQKGRRILRTDSFFPAENGTAHQCVGIFAQCRSCFLLNNAGADHGTLRVLLQVSTRNMLSVPKRIKALLFLCECTVGKRGNKGQGSILMENESDLVHEFAICAQYGDGEFFSI